jgi:hypothetical protein
MFVEAMAAMQEDGVPDMQNSYGGSSREQHVCYKFDVGRVGLRILFILLKTATGTAVITASSPTVIL